MSNSSNASPPRSIFGLGVIGCVGYATHAGYHILNGTPQDTIWICHISALLVGVALMIGSARLNAAGLLCLTVGFPMWVLYLFSGEPFIWTSPLTHVLGLVVAIIGARKLGGVPPYTWTIALGFVALLMVAARLFTASEANVNLAFGPMSGLSLWAFDGIAHWTLQLASWAIALFVLDWIWRRMLGPSTKIGLS